MRAGADGRAAPDPDQQTRARTERAILRLSGERGYGAASIAAVIERSGSNRARFYKTWDGKEDCYLSAYRGVAEDLSARVLAACGEAPDWTAGVRAALGELEAFVEEDRAAAAGVIREVHVAGGAALARREALAGGIAGAIDRVRQEGPLPRRFPPQRTSAFVLAAIEATVIRSLNDGRALRGVLGGAFYLTVASYLGGPAAQRALQDHPDW